MADEKACSMAGKTVVMMVDLRGDLMVAMRVAQMVVELAVWLDDQTVANWVVEKAGEMVEMLEKL